MWGASLVDQAQCSLLKGWLRLGVYRVLCRWAAAIIE
jgi:hypothetical protein